MIRLIGVLLVVATGLTACRPFTSEATADLPGQISVTMSVRPMAGWHSDWHRTLTIATPDGTTSQPLFEDTGWWRGSNLYLHASGVYVLHEGQAGCILLPTRPLTADDEPDISCDRAGPPRSRNHRTVKRISGVSTLTVLPGSVLCRPLRRNTGRGGGDHLHVL